MIPFILRKIRELGCEVACEGDKLKLYNPSVLTEEQKDWLKKYKPNILQVFKQQEEAIKQGWITYPFGEAYEKQVSRNSYLFLFREENGTFTAIRGTWREKIGAETEKVIASNVDFKTALEKASNYAGWFRKR